MWLFVLLLFVPGLAVSEFFGFYAKSDRLAVKLAFIIGSSLSITTVLFAIWNFLGPISSALIWGYLGASIASISAIAFRRRNLALLAKPRLVDFVPILSAVSVALVALALFQKYPIFPAYPDPDYAQHIGFTLSMMNHPVPLPQSLLYYGVDYQFALALLGSNALPIVTVRETMSILSAVGVFLIYGAAQRASGKESTANIATILYAFSGFAWFGMVEVSGVYPNFFAVLISLFALTVLPSKMPKALTFLIASTFTLTALAFTHYTAVVLIPVVLLISLTKDHSEGKLVRYFPVLLIACGIALALLLTKGAILSLMSYFLFASAPYYASTWLGSVLPVSSVSSLAIVFSDDLALSLYAILGILAVMFAVAIKPRSSGIYPIAIWLVFPLLLSLFSVNWRFAYLLITPLEILVAVALDRLTTLGFSDKASKRYVRKDRTGWKVGWTLIFLLVVFFSGSRMMFAISDATTYTSQVSHEESSVYNAMRWTNNSGLHGSLLTNIPAFKIYYPSMFGSSVSITYIPLMENTTAQITKTMQAKNYSYLAWTDFLGNGKPKSTLAFYPLWTDNLTTIYAFKPT